MEEVVTWLPWYATPPAKGGWGWEAIPMSPVFSFTNHISPHTTSAKIKVKPAGREGIAHVRPVSHTVTVWRSGKESLFCSLTFSSSAERLSTLNWEKFDPLFTFRKISAHTKTHERRRIWTNTKFHKIVPKTSFSSPRVEKEMRKPPTETSISNIVPGPRV